MDMKEKIEFLEYIVKDLLIDEIGRCNFSGVKNVKSKVNDIITSLREGEKYKKMWGEFKGMCWHDSVKRVMKDHEQKYFPKPKDRWHKINNTIYNLNTIGGKFDIKELTNLLIELRDEEL